MEIVLLDYIKYDILYRLLLKTILSQPLLRSVKKSSNLCLIKENSLYWNPVCDDKEKITNYLYSIIVRWRGW
jgi:hypothetical protein